MRSTWKVYRETAEVRDGVVLPTGADVMRFANRPDAHMAFRREVAELVAQGWQFSDEVAPEHLDGVEEFAGLVLGQELALVVLMEEVEE